MIDFHNHVLPGVDDGAADTAQAVKALGRMREAGVQTVIATPHLDATLIRYPDLLQERLSQFERARAALLAAAPADSRVEPGVELKLDDPRPACEDARLRLAGTDFVLVEFAYMMIPPAAEQAFAHLRQAGRIPVLAHPERYDGLEGRLEQVTAWRRAGVYLQVNGPSLLGHHGTRAERCAARLLKEGLVDYIASDYHARGPFARQGWVEALTAAGGAEHAELLCVVNPRRLLAGEPPLPVPRLERPLTFWARMREVFR
jgi:protein-tyrosine phosphatase